MGRGPGGHEMAMLAGEKARDFKKTFKTLIQYLKPYRIQLIIVLVFAIASSVFMIIGPKLLGNAITAMSQGFFGKAIDFDYIGNIVIMLAILYLISAACTYVQGFIMTGISMKITFQFRKNIAEKIDRLPLKYFDRVPHGEVLSRVTNDIDTISNTLAQGLTQIVTSVTQLVGVLVMMFTISWLMTLASFLILPLSVILIRLIVKVSQKYFRQQQEYLGHANGHVEEMYGGHTIMRAFNGEEKSIKKFTGFNEHLYTSAWKSQFLSGAMMPIMTFVSNLGYVLVIILGGYLAVVRAITIGDIVAFVQYIRMFTQPIMQTAQIASVMQMTGAAAERVFEFLDEEEIPQDVGTFRTPATVSGQVQFEHVRFGYNPEKIIINDFSADIEPGQKVAIVGPTGAGKTTLVKLIMRFYELNSGSIKIDGTDITDYGRRDLRSIFGMVLQDTWLFNGSIRDNVKYGAFEATEEEMITAAKMAYVDDFVHALPHGYDMELNEESSNVSQGQKQLLTIARAFLSNPRILILDEATSSVDTRTEVLIQKAMQQLMKDRTSFVIAHRLSTIRDADMILVMDEGDIVEQGTHESLLAADGFYTSLYNSQFDAAYTEEEAPREGTSMFPPPDTMPPPSPGM
ncbi:MAG: ABC transporter ATP-binding protein/permease [Dehalococcoidales bacterium]|nr:ABC transporter ATP-binding protein/permease [Dehalococcoidales bacterium]